MWANTRAPRMFWLWVVTGRVDAVSSGGGDAGQCGIHRYRGCVVGNAPVPVTAEVNVARGPRVSPALRLPAANPDVPQPKESEGGVGTSGKTRRST